MKNLSLKKSLKVFVGIPNLRNHDKYHRFFPSVINHIKAQDSPVTLMEPYVTPPASGKFREGDKSRLEAIADRMNNIIDKFMTTNATHLWIVDGDVEVPQHTLSTLLKLDVDLASGVYPFHNFNKCNAMLFGRMGDDPCGFFRPRDWDYLKDIVLGEEDPVSGGSGCLLVKRRVFKRYHPKISPLRFTRRGPNGECGADVYFWKRAQDAGFTARIHGGVVCGHLPLYPLKKYGVTWGKDSSPVISV